MECFRLAGGFVGEIGSAVHRLVLKLYLQTELSELLQLPPH